MSIILCKVPDDVSCYLKPFLCIKHIDGTGKECLINIPAVMNMLSFWSFQLKTLKCLYNMGHFFGWMDVWGRIKKERVKLTEDLCDWEKLFRPKASVIG